MNRRFATDVLVLAMAALLVLVSACNRPVSTGPLPLPTAGAQGVQGTPSGGQLPTEVVGTVFAGATATVASGTALPQPAQPTAGATLAPAAQATVAPAPTTAPAVQATAAPGGTTSYTVKPGDRLFSIGRQFGVNPYTIAQANGIYPPYTIYVGQVLTIPGGTPVTVTPGPGPNTYVVQRGDTIFSIARRLGKTPASIINANNLMNPNLIFPGQVLRIP